MRGSGQYWSRTVECIKDVLDRTSPAPGRHLRTNQALCMRLRQELQSTLDVLQKELPEPGRQGPLVTQLYCAVKRAEMLVVNCSTKHWLPIASTPLEAMEGFVKIIKELQFWRRMVVVQLYSKTVEEIFDEVFGKSRQLDMLEEEMRKDSTTLVSKLEDEMGMLRASPRRFFMFRRHKRLELAEFMRLKLSSQGYGRADRANQLLLRPPPQLETAIKQLSQRVRAAPQGGIIMDLKWMKRKYCFKVISGINQSEAIIHVGLHHPHIVTLICAFEDVDKDKTCLVMEEEEGDFAELIEKKMKDNVTSPFPLPVAIDIMIQVADALRYLHSKKVGHRDIKSKNVLWTRDETLIKDDGEAYKVKVADFGSAKADLEEISSEERHQNRTWKTGTTRWRAPELYEQSKAGSDQMKYPLMVDIFSLGIFFYELLTGKLPYADTKDNKKIQERILRDPAPGPLSDLPPYLEFCLQSCWGLEPCRRPNSEQIYQMLLHARNLKLGIIYNDRASLFAYETRDGERNQFEGNYFRSYTRSACQIVMRSKTMQHIIYCLGYYRGLISNVLFTVESTTY
jgi:serine/threonine protein kinase